MVNNLDHYIEQFERNAIASGAQVHWAATAEEACAITIGICRAAGARSVTRSKSMLGEEIGLPHALAEAVSLSEKALAFAEDKPTQFARAQILDEAWARHQQRARGRQRQLDLQQRVIRRVRPGSVGRWRARGAWAARGLL